MAFWATLERQDLHRYVEWYNCEHMAERGLIPGFQTGRRYVVEGENGRFLQFYETETSSVLGSKPYLDALNNTTPWTKEALTWFRDSVRNIYELIGSCGKLGMFTAPYLAALRFNLEDGQDGNLLQIYTSKWLSALCEMPHVLRARLYRVDEEISKIMTSERKIYSGGPGGQRYLAFVEISNPFDQVGDPIAKASEQVFQSDHGRLDEAEVLLEQHCQYANFRGIRHLLNTHEDPVFNYADQDYLNHAKWVDNFGLLDYILLPVLALFLLITGDALWKNQRQK